MNHLEWKSDSLFKPSLKSTSSTSRLAEFHSKLISCKRTSNYISIPTWKVFQSQIRGNTSPTKLEKPRFDYYSDITSFRSNSPRAGASPLWRVKGRTGSIASNLSGKSSPKPTGKALNVNLNQNLQVIRTEELRKAIQAVNEMSDEDLGMIPRDYAEELYEFCKVVRDRIKG